MRQERETSAVCSSQEHSNDEVGEFMAQLAARGRKPARMQRAVVPAIKKLRETVWVDETAKEEAIESLRSLFHCVENSLVKQAELHSKELSSCCDYNTSLRALDLLKPHAQDAKLFAVLESERQASKVKGPGCVWNLTAIDRTREYVPREYLERLTLLKYNGITPDRIYVAVPYEEARPRLREVLGEEAKSICTSAAQIVRSSGKAVEAFARATERMVPMEDPLLICAFGSGPVFLVQLGKWE
jgi:hypothetical protein